MDLWHPPIDQPHLLEWWRPALLASRAARVQRIAWPIYLDELVLKGRVDRPSRPSVWIYQHAQSRRELYLDGTGQPYRFTRTPNARSLGRFTAIDLRTAVWAADLPAHVEPVFYDEPPRHARDWSYPGVDDFEEAEQPHPPVDAPPSPRRRGHLTVYDGGVPQAG